MRVYLSTAGPMNDGNDEEFVYSAYSQFKSLHDSRLACFALWGLIFG